MSEEFFRIELWQRKLNEERERTAKWKNGYGVLIDQIQELKAEKSKVILEKKTAEEQLKDLQNRIDELEHKVINAFDQMEI